MFHCFLNKAALSVAVVKENVEIVHLLLSCKNIDVNFKSVQIQFFL